MEASIKLHIKSAISSVCTELAKTIETGVAHTPEQRQRLVRHVVAEIRSKYTVERINALFPTDVDARTQFSELLEASLDDHNELFMSLFMDGYEIMQEFRKDCDTFLTKKQKRSNNMLPRNKKNNTQSQFVMTVPRKQHVLVDSVGTIDHSPQVLVNNECDEAKMQFADIQRVLTDYLVSMLPATDLNRLEQSTASLASDVLGIVRLISCAVCYVQRFSQLQGHQKLDVVKRVLKNIVVEHMKGDEMLLFTIDVFLEPFVSELVRLGRIGLNHVSSQCRKWCC